MQLIDSITVRSQGNDRHVMLFAGNPANLPEQEAVDVLIVFAFPDDPWLHGAPESAEVMLDALTDASVHWLSVGSPLERIKIVILDSAWRKRTRI